jgi:hypothetical protein
MALMKSIFERKDEPDHEKDAVGGGPCRAVYIHVGQHIRRQKTMLSWLRELLL